MRCSSNSGAWRPGAVLLAGLCAALPLAWCALVPGDDTRANLLVNGGFELNAGEGTVPRGWQVVDEHAGYFGWIAPRVRAEVGGVRARSGRAMAACDTESMGVDSNGRDEETPRSALFQTIVVPAGTRGEFSLFYNDLGSSALGHISALRLGYTLDSEDIRSLSVVAAGADAGAAAEAARAGVWSRPFFRVSQRLPFHRGGAGDWARAAIPVALPAGEKPVRLTLWIGIFDNQNSTELGYWRLDDAVFRAVEAR